MRYIEKRLRELKQDQQFGAPAQVRFKEEGRVRRSAFRQPMLTGLVEERLAADVVPESVKAGSTVQRVYVIPAREFVKIGITADISRRIRDLRSANPIISLVYFLSQPLSDAQLVERASHDSLKYCRVSGEWFRCEPKVAADAVRRQILLLGMAEPDDDT